MKKIIALALVLSLFAVLAACTQVTRISIDDPVQIKLEKEGSGMSVTLTDPKTVDRITDVVCQIPLQEAEDSGNSWNYKLSWLDSDGKTITTIVLAGSQIRWEGSCYNLGVGVNLSVVTDVLESIPVLKQ